MKIPLLLCIGCVAVSFAADTPPSKPIPAITPGKVIIPLEKMRRIWGELVSLDPGTRTGTFRKEDTDELMPFTVMPYAELLHHATRGDLEDFKIGERAIFRLHVNEKEEWVWLTYIQDEMNMLNGHKEYFHVDALDAATGKLTCKWASADLSFVRKPEVVIETDPETRYWRGGQPVKFSDIRVGDKLRTKTHGRGAGEHRVAWEVFLDDESLLHFQSQQKTVHADRIKTQGAPGYVDEADGRTLRLTLFNEADEYLTPLKQGAVVQVAAAGTDRKPVMQSVRAKVLETGRRKGERQTFVVLELDEPQSAFAPAKLARLWINAP
jgi:hypothetical protein